MAAPKVHLELTAPIIEWNLEKGYGFLQHGPRRVFVHIRDFSRRHRYPKIGDVIHFQMGRDAHGRECAVQASHQPLGGRITPGALFLLALLLILPAVALHHLNLDPKILFGYLAGISLITWVFYAHDKKRAQSGGWRVPESTFTFSNSSAAGPRHISPSAPCATKPPKPALKQFSG